MNSDDLSLLPVSTGWEIVCLFKGTQFSPQKQVADYAPLPR